VDRRKRQAAVKAGDGGGEDDKEQAGGGGGGGGGGDAHVQQALSGLPLPTDHLTHALPMLAPYPVILASCKYRVKLLPGGLKKGKAGQAALHAWTQAAQSPGFGTAREAELVKNVTDAELVSSIIGDCKVVGEAVGGGTAKGGKKK